MNKPTIGRIVHYKTTESRRKAMEGNPANKGAYNNSQSVLPAIVVAVWSDTCVNLQVIVDGHAGTMWVTSANLGDGEGNWNWPVKE